MTLFEWLAWLFQSGGSVMVASWLLERFPAYKKIENPETKKYIFWGVSVALSSGAFAVITYVPMATLALLAPYFGFAFGTFGVIFLGTLFHQTDTKDQAARKANQ